MYLYIYLSLKTSCKPQSLNLHVYTAKKKKERERREEKKKSHQHILQKKAAFWEQPDLIADNIGDLGTSSAPCHCEVLCTEGKVVPEDRSCQHKN